jgi:hypothetical protein
VINFLIGWGYVQSNESDILLLDISNNNEYIWNNNFEPSIPEDSKSKTVAIVCAVLGSVFGALIAFGGFFLYRRIKKKQDQKDVTQVPGEREGYSNYGQGGGTLQPTSNYEQRISSVLVSTTPTVPVYNNGQGMFQTPNNGNMYVPVVPASAASTIPIYNHGQEVTSYEQTKAPNKNYNPGQEAIPHNPGQEAITYNHRQESIPISMSNNERISVIDINNLKNELRQEIMQNLKQEMLQNSGDYKK